MNLWERLKQDLLTTAQKTSLSKEAYERPAPVVNVLGGGYGAKALREELDSILSAPDGTVNDAINRAAFNLGTLAAGGVLSDGEVWAGFARVAEERWGEPMDAAFRKTATSGYNSGMQNPRGIPQRTPEERVFDEAVAAAEEEMSDLLAELITEEQLATLPKPVPVVQGLLYAGTTAWVIGEPNAGKSLFALDWGQCVSRGLPWKGREVRKGKVLYVVAEGRTGIDQRCRAWRKSNGQSTNDDMLFLPRDVQVTNPADWAALIRTAQKLKPSMMVIDTMAQCTIGVNENSAQEMGAYIAGVKKIAESTGALVLSLHHVGKSGDIRGTTAIQGAADTVVKCELDDDTKQITLYNRRDRGGKSKDAAPAPDMHFQLTTHDLGDDVSSVTVEELKEIGLDDF